MEIKEILKEGTAIDFFKNLIANGEMEEDDSFCVWSYSRGWTNNFIETLERDN